MYSDSGNTLAVAGILFATEELGVDNIMLVIMVIEIQLFAFVGNFVFLKIEQIWNIDNKNMLSLHLIVFIILPCYGLLGFFLPIGLAHTWEIFVFGFVYGMVIGSVQSYARSLYAQLIPVGKETEYFSLYQITDKGSSWIGPAVVAIISNYASIRWGLVYVIGV